METTYNDFPAEPLSLAQNRRLNWHRSRSLAEILAIAETLDHPSKQKAPEGFHFVLSSTLGYFPHHLTPHKPMPRLSLCHARRFDNILLVVSHAKFWMNYLPEEAAKSITVRLIPV